MTVKTLQFLLVYLLCCQCSEEQKFSTFASPYLFPVLQVPDSKFYTDFLHHCLISCGYKQLSEKADCVEYNSLCFMLKFHIGPTLNFQAVRPFCEKHTGSWWKKTCLQSSTAPKFLSFKEKGFKWEAVIINIKNTFWWLQTAERRIKWKSFLKIKCSGMKLSAEHSCGNEP